MSQHSMVPEKWAVLQVVQFLTVTIVSALKHTRVVQGTRARRQGPGVAHMWVCPVDVIACTHVRHTCDTHSTPSTLFAQDLKADPPRRERTMPG